MLTVVLRRAEVSRHGQALHLLETFRKAFAAGLPSTGRAERFTDAGRSIEVRHASSAALPGTALSTQGLLQLTDTASGKLLAVMDARHVAALRSAVVGALAIDLLSRTNAKNVALIGGGRAVPQALKGLRLVRSIERVTLFDVDLAGSTMQAMELRHELAVRVSACESIDEAVAAADIVVVTSDAALPAIELPRGVHVSVLGAERVDRPVVSTSALSGARWFCDAGPGPSWAPALADLSSVATARSPGRSSPDDTTAFLSLNAPVLDLITAWHVYEGAQHDETVTRLDLES